MVKFLHERLEKREFITTFASLNIDVMNMRVLTFLLCLISTLHAQNTYTLSGHVLDSVTQEPLVGAAIYVTAIGDGAVADIHGRYEIRLRSGEYRFRISCMGYQTQEMTRHIDRSQVFDIYLKSADMMLSAVEVNSVRSNQQITRTVMGKVDMNIEAIRKIPTLLGEVDVIKALQLLPGVMATSEGGSGFSVRGGGPDQNLIQLDGATVYNPSHCLGFFSVFNNDAVNDVTIYKGDIPAEYGGRMSSVIDVTMRQGDDSKYKVSGGIGLLSARLAVEGPIIKDKLSFLVAGRRSYFDIFLPLSNNPMAKKATLYFWDLNGKLTYQISPRHQLSLSAYSGKDVMRFENNKANYGNTVASINWKHQVSDKLVSNLSTNYTLYRYGMFAKMGSVSASNQAELSDIGLKYQWSWFPNEKHKVSFGYHSFAHLFDPGQMSMELLNSGLIADSSGFVDLSMNTLLPKKYAWENNLYMSDDYQVAPWLAIRYGLRLSAFSNVGRDKIFHYDDQYQLVDSVIYGKGDLYNTFWALEPRIGLNFIINPAHSIKANFSRTAQFVQLAQSSNGGNPIDQWFSANPNVKPQVSYMYALGYFSNWLDNLLEVSAEVYYKDMQNTIDFKDFAQLYGNEQLYAELRYGQSRAYGLELMLKKSKGDLNGWISYTLSRAERTIPGVNEGKTYLAPYDRTHNISIVLNWVITPRVEVSANWVYYTGNPYTVPVGRAEINGVIIPIFSERNSFRMPDYHRLDLSVTLRPKEKPKRKWSYDFNIGLYNVYNRHNPWTINFLQDPHQPSRTYAEMTYLFGLVPSVTFNFRF